ncbi:MAG: iron-sulfur cluster assembly accessory protein [Gammaproteobacteria bacterium]|nr:iron-sulfur cluster assembly accessory protein [Gammaproteobacteria bacterium]
MITITEPAAEQIRKAVGQTGADSLFLRLAARVEDDGKFEYGMGFDERKDTDTHWISNGVHVLVAEACKNLLEGATLDYVELNPGDFRFIFVNPNDPTHTVTADRPS